MATAAGASSPARRRPRRGSKGPNSDLSRTLTDCTRRGDAAAAMAAFDTALSGPDAPRLLAHQYNQLFHLLATADADSLPNAAAAARRVFSHMLGSGASPSEATITSLARVTASDASNPAAADEAFDLVATMRDKYGVAPRLRSYSPVLAAFRRAGDAGKAYAVDAHMEASAVAPEEPEIAALFDVSAKAGDADKVYEYMHKLSRTVDCVGEETAEVLEGWFRSDKAAMAGKAEWDACNVKDAIVANGGGCHRLGWLGSGPWTVQRVRVGGNGQCEGCGCRLACVDIDVEETQRFADSVAGLALQRETKTNFSQFQEWLEGHGAYEAIVDGANIALYQQNFAEGGFSLTQLDAVVTELRDRYNVCDFYPGVSCGDPRFTGGDGNNFYFHGKKDHDFCIVSDADLHINAHFIGKRNPTMSRDFTWIQALGIRFADHRLYMGALKTAKWNSDDDRLELAFDGAPVDVPAELGARWESAAVPGLTVTRTAATNAVRVQLAGVLDIMANVVPITEQDSRIHNYGVTEEDSLAHLDLGFKFYDLSDDVHGVLGQTYRSDYVNNLSVSASMPVMGGAPSYVVSDIFSTDCAVARFGRRAGISMVTGRAN
ncbi:hypothetical protein OsI_05356 [Oryza sativa Indica Group]|uniref:ribonuclease P n=1 Tax=Oryza sativa subsp. indica TaxID=39946 RepID=B8A9V7_ORYSI|nr:hypothetical protein OsI_05356 [Oryza sativa Indica Group]